MELLALMEQHERLLAELYEKFARLLPEHEEFWLKLAHEEVMHSLWVRNFSEKIVDERLYMEPTSLTLSSLQSSVNSLNTLIDSLDKKRVDMVYAISIALDYENALIERYALNQYQSVSPLFKKLLNDLQSSSKRHREAVDAAFTKLRNQ